MGIGPLRCSPRALLESYNCTATHTNAEVMNQHNAMLSAGHLELNDQVFDAQIIFCDVYRGIAEIMHNPELYGFAIVRDGCCALGRRIGKVFPTRLSLAEIKSATKGFQRSKIIGEVVYEGSLASRKEVAIKRYSQASQVDPINNPFEPEVAAVVTCLKLKNLVQIIGWCCEGDELVLVSDFIPNRSLDKFLLFNKATNKTSFYLNCERIRKVSSEQLKPREAVISSPIHLSNGKFGSAHQVLASGIPSFEDKDSGGGDGGHPGCLMCYEGTQMEPFDVQDRFDKVESTRKRSKLDEAALGMGAGVILLVITTILVVWIRRKGYGKRGDGGNRFIGKAFPATLSLAEIKSATKGFHRSKIISEGAYGVLYEDSLASGKEVAIKRSSQASQVDPIRNPCELKLAALIGCLKHKNLVQLIGCYCEEDELVLVYGFIPNGSLDRLLHFNKATNRTSFFLNWESRRKIVIGVASALTYLHEECETQIIHRDVKVCNIMLDGDFDAKFGDFGLTELYERKFSCRARTATIPAGKMGYLAPGYVHSGVPTTEKTDIYSFGVVALEVATGRRPLEIDGCMLVDKMWEMWSKGKLMEFVDSRLLGRFEMREMERMLTVGLACVHPDRKERPRMKEAERMLRGDAPNPILPSRKPEIRLQSVSLMQGDRNGSSDTPPRGSPSSHFNRHKE